MDFNAYLTLASSSDFKAATGIVYLSTMVKISHHTHFQASLHIPWELTWHQFSWRLPPHKLVNICGHLVPVNEWILQWHLKLHFYCASYLLYMKGNKSGRKYLVSFHFSYCTKNSWKNLDILMGQCLELLSSTNCCQPRDSCQLPTSKRFLPVVVVLLEPVLLSSSLWWTSSSKPRSRFSVPSCA